MTWGFGYSLTYFIDDKDRSFLEKNIIRVGIGLGIFPILAVLLNLVRIQLYWPVFLALSMIIPVFSLLAFFRKGGKIDIKPSFKLKKSSLYILLALFFAASVFFVFYEGSFKYQYLEDDDPWFHAMNAKYVKEFRSFSRVDSNFWSFREPYPQGFVVLMGVLHQTNDNIIWTLKFFNVLLIALSVIFFYLFAEYFIGDRNKALFATFGIAVIPCFLGHFIWASTLAIALFFPALYCLERTRESSGRSRRLWFIASSVVISSILVTQPSNSFVFGVMFFFYWLFTAVSARKMLWRLLLPGIIAVIIAVCLFWAPMLFKYGLIDTAAANTINLKGGIGSGLESIVTIGSGGEAVYSFSDFMIAKKANKIDNPIGIGIVLFWLGLLSLLLVFYQLFRKGVKSLFAADNRWKLISLVWCLIAVIGINGNRMPFPVMMPHRWWAILAIPLVLLCAEGLAVLAQSVKRFKIPSVIVYSVFILGIILTSAYPKYVVQTSNWPPGVNWGSMDEIAGYLSYVEPLPDGTKVFPICSSEFKVLAYDKWAEPWDPDYIAFKNSAVNRSAEEISSWLKSRGYEYMVVDSYCVNVYGGNRTNEMLQEIGTYSGFGVVASNKGMYLFRVL